MAFIQNYNFNFTQSLLPNHITIFDNIDKFKINEDILQKYSNKKTDKLYDLQYNLSVINTNIDDFVTKLKENLEKTKYPNF